MEPVTITMNDSGQFTDVDFEQWILNEIENRAFNRKMVAHTYSILIRKGHANWRQINEAILKRWSPSGLSVDQNRSVEKTQHTSGLH